MITLKTRQFGVVRLKMIITVQVLPPPKSFGFHRLIVPLGFGICRLSELVLLGIYSQTWLDNSSRSDMDLLTVEKWKGWGCGSCFYRQLKLHSLIFSYYQGIQWWCEIWKMSPAVTNPQWNITKVLWVLCNFLAYLKSLFFWLTKSNQLLQL